MWDGFGNSRGSHNAVKNMIAVVVVVVIPRGYWLDGSERV